MLLHADRIAVEGAHGTLVPPTSLTVRTGELTLVHAEPGEGVTAFGLTLADRFHPHTGTVSVRGLDTHTGPREVTAVVDAPAVTAPDGALPLRVVVGEELSFAGKPAHRSGVTEWLATQNLAQRANDRFENLPAATRSHVLTTLAAMRPGVRVLVLDRPDRHTSDVSAWRQPATEHARQGYAVVVLTATTAPHHLPWPPALLGSLEQPTQPSWLPESDSTGQQHEHDDTTDQGGTS